MCTRLALLALCVATALGCPTAPPPPPPNTPPALSLSAPTASQLVRVGQPVALAASVEDAEDGEALGAHVVWVSSLSGQLARGASTSGTFTAPGEQTLTASITDSGGEVASASVTLVVLAATAPSAAILQPTAGATFHRGETFALACEARTAQGATLPRDFVQWTSALSGPLPSGEAVRASLAVAGEDTLTCTATDPVSGVRTSASVRVTVRPEQAPAVLITRPEAVELFVKAGEPAPYAPTLSFRATAQDFQAAGGPGNLDASVQWTLEPGGVSLGTGPALTYTFTTPGTYTITASATDRLGLRTSDSVRVRLVTNLPPRCAISRPRDNGGRVLLGSATELEGVCVDPETGTRLAPTWTAGEAGSAPLGSGFTVSTTFTTGGALRLSACASDPEDPTLRGCAERALRVITNTAPMGCAILAPLANTSVPAGTALTLEGSASDAEDPQASLRYTWTSSRDGELLQGASASTRRLTTAGNHSLTLTVTDPWGLSCSASANVRVNGAPRVDPLVVKQGGMDCLKQSCRSGQDVTASSRVTDAPEGVADVEWLDSVTGRFGTTESATLAAPETGKHTLVLRATDTGGAVSRAVATVTLAPNTSPPLFTSLLTTSRPVAALAVAASDVRYVDGGSPTVFRLGAPAENLTVQGAALALLRLEGASGPVFFVGTDSGVERCASGTCTHFNGGPLAEAGDRVTALAALQAPDLLLLGTDKGLVLTRASDPALGGKPGTLVGQRVLEGLQVRQVVVSPASTAAQVKAWVATDEGLAELTLSVEEPFEPATAQVSTLRHLPPAIPSEDVLSLALSPEGRVFAGTSKGFSALGEEGPALKAAPWNLPDDTVRALLFERWGGGEAARDVLWVATGNGLIRYDVTLDIPTRFGTEDALQASDIRSLARGPDGTRYIGTVSGLASYAGSLP